MAAKGGGGGGAVCTQVEDAVDQGCPGAEEGVLGSTLDHQLAFHYIIMCGEHEGDEGGGVECGLSCGGSVDESFAAEQARVADAEGCRLQSCAGAFAGAEEEK